MSVISIIHILGGSVAVTAGFFAMFSKKGQTPHRRAGQCFSISMIMVCLSGFYFSYARDLQFTYILSALSLYLVTTGHYAVNCIIKRREAIETLGLLLNSLFTIGCLTVSVLGVLLDWYYPPSEPSYEAYAAIGVCSVLFLLGDVKILRAGDLATSRRLKRHIVRMCSAMLIATTIFASNIEVILPQSLQNHYIITIPMILVMITMLVYTLGFRWLVKKT